MGKAAQEAPDPTREKLLEAAGQVFAEQGFYTATVREICSRAGANVAAVNYYFGDKAELYAEVLREAVCAAHDTRMRDALSALSPIDALHGFIRHMLGKLCGGGRPSWTMRLMAHEIMQPTPALGRVVDEIIAPNYAMLRRIIGRMLDLSPDHDRTRLCAHSIVGQVLHYAQARPVIARLWPDLKMTEEGLDHIAQHIAVFSLAYLKSGLKATRKSS